MYEFQLNLLAARCPSAMSYVRSSLLKAIENNVSGQLVISTIEPSMTRDLPYFINTLDNVVLNDNSTTVLPESVKAAWIESGEAFEEDVEGIDKVHLFTITIN